MKRIAGLLFIATLFMGGTTEAKPPQEFSGNVGIFHSSLSPYGEWVNSNVGFAWRPQRVNRHWRPYMYGRWAWTDYGWYWVSDEPFGWATFHYGRWTYDEYYGWIWLPDRVWGPSWVEWRYDNDYIGWAPLTPYAHFSMNVGITWSNHWAAPVHYWNFVPCRRFTSDRAHDYIEPVERTRRIFGNTRGVVDIHRDRDRVVNAGIDTRFVERRGNVRVSRVDVVDRNEASADRFVNENRRSRIETYRPKIDGDFRTDRTSPGDYGSGRDERPSNVDRRRDERPSNVDRRRDDRPSGVDRQRYERPSGVDRQRDERPSGVDRQRDERPSGVDRQRDERPSGVDRQRNERPSGVDRQRNERPSGVDRQRNERPSGVDRQRNERQSGVDRQRNERQSGVDRQRDAQRAPSGRGADPGTVLREQNRERVESQKNAHRERNTQSGKGVEQQRSRGEERKSLNRGSQQSDRDRSPGRTPQQHGEQRARGRRPG